MNEHVTTEAIAPVGKVTAGTLKPPRKPKMTEKRLRAIRSISFWKGFVVAVVVIASVNSVIYWWPK